ncbi:hypothetical protein CYMTET_51707 [Cymbomonas tetramitiformis]|uniref:Uncharacterized protein n=1 Tax=Cymbomonas tetramitiformis TaxID=36881 RepID=A0AAE0ETF2_9CHLO|nr:hypothetical protein CYMTET_51707 [Cymbomonas tetramitiformis]
MSMGEFRSFINDCKLLDGAFTDVGINTIFANVQDTRDGTEDEEPELNFGEFQEAVAAITQYKVPNPYQSFAKRLDTFLTRQVFTMAKMTRAAPKKTKRKGSV